jgi:hypothetical protein
MHRRSVLLAALPQGARAATILRVGPQHEVKTLATAARVATDGALIEVEAGDYLADVAVWPQHDLSLRAVGGRVRLIASGAHAQGKGIFVTTGKNQRIEGFDFIGAKVPDGNGAGIRLEAGSLSLLDCRFEGNENGLLTANHPEIELTLENCDFGAIAPGRGQTHNCYVGKIKRLTVTGCYFHHGHLGHLLKSRAALNLILYSRLTDEIGGRASYELEFPNGGVAVVMGCLIGQSSTTDNSHLLSVGGEGLDAPRHELHLVNNTLVDQRPGGGIWLRVAPGVDTVRWINNLLVGPTKLIGAPGWELRNNHAADWRDFVQPQREDFRLKAGGPLRGKLADAGVAAGLPLALARQYRHRARSEPLGQAARSPGAFQD